MAWVPGWYELDQPLEVGVTAYFAFWRTVPERLRGPEPLVLYNDLRRPGDMATAWGTIAAIRHPDLGPVRRVDTRGLDYTITLADDTELLVNAEEEPGKLYERAGAEWREASRAISGWRFVIEFSALAEPTSAESAATTDLPNGTLRGTTTMASLDRITVNPARMNGQPCVRNLRLTVRRVVEAVALYPDRNELKREYPELDDEDIRQALAFAAANLDDKVIELATAR